MIFVRRQDKTTRIIILATQTMHYFPWDILQVFCQRFTASFISSSIAFPPRKNNGVPCNDDTDRDDILNSKPNQKKKHRRVVFLKMPTNNQQPTTNNQQRHRLHGLSCFFWHFSSPLEKFRGSPRFDAGGFSHKNPMFFRLGGWKILSAPPKKKKNNQNLPPRIPPVCVSRTGLQAA